MLCKDVKKWLIKHQPDVPKGNGLRRLTVLALMISALIRSGRASLQSIGNELESTAELESRIKQAKRWLNNKWTDTHTHFIPYIVPIIRSLSKGGELLLAIDGSGIGSNCSVLMISIIWRRRAIPVCWVSREAPKGHFSQQMHIELIAKVAELFNDIISTDCRIILLGDGEFDGKQLQQTCLDHQWDYVLKTAKDTLIADNPQMENPSAFGHISPPHGEQYLMLHDMYITSEGFGPVNLLYWHDKNYQHPLFLLTNLEYPATIAYYYRRRYRIETFFGDIKSRGFNIHRTKINKAQTLDNLLIVAALAFILAILFEFEARSSQHLPKFCRKDRVNKLSVFQLGLRAILFYIKKRLRLSFQFSKNFP